MHRTIPARIHGIIDYAIVAVLLLAPSLAGFSGVPASLAYILGATWLLVTLITDQPAGAWDIIPLPARGGLDLIFGAALVILPWFAGFHAQPAARTTYVILGLAILVVQWLSDYHTISLQASDHEDQHPA